MTKNESKTELQDKDQQKDTQYYQTNSDINQEEPI